MLKSVSLKSGFTLLEIMLVISILVIIAAISRDFYGSYVSGVQLEDNAKTIIYDLRNTRDKAMNGLSDRSWGVHFINNTSDYYEIFSTPTDYNDLTKSIIITSYLKNGLFFDFPSEGTNFDVLFNKIDGRVVSSSVIIKSGATQRIISVKEQGLIN